jgi:hypothetical protein
MIRDMQSSVLENKHQSLINILDDCVEACHSCATADLRENELKMMVRCVELDIDCAEICNLTSHYLSRNSEFSTPMAKQCAEICDACAEECEKHPEMPHCVECAKVCRKCAQECREL